MEYLELNMASALPTTILWPLDIKFSQKIILCKKKKLESPEWALKSSSNTLPFSSTTTYILFIFFKYVCFFKFSVSSQSNERVLLAKGEKPCALRCYMGNSGMDVPHTNFKFIKIIIEL